MAVYVLWDLSKSHSKQLDDRDRAFRTFVDQNNHKVTQIILESTIAIKESSESIKKASELIVQASDVLKEVRNHFIREHHE